MPFETNLGSDRLMRVFTVPGSNGLRRVEAGRALLRLRSSVHRFMRRERRGAVAVEFTLVTPILLVVMLSCMDLGRLILAYQKTQLTSNTVGDLVSRAEPAQNTASEICAALQAANLVMRPFSLADTDMILVSSITIEGEGGGAVTVTQDWDANLTGGDSATCAIDDTDHPLPGVPLGLVTGLDNDETDNIIYTRVAYRHEAWFWSFLDTDPSHPIIREAIHKPRVAPLDNIASG